MGRRRCGGFVTTQIQGQEGNSLNQKQNQINQPKIKTRQNTKFFFFFMKLSGSLLKKWKFKLLHLLFSKVIILASPS